MENPVAILDITAGAFKLPRLFKMFGTLMAIDANLMARIEAMRLHKNPGTIGRDTQRQLIRNPGCIHAFSSGSHIPLATSNRCPFILTWLGRGVLPAWE